CHALEELLRRLDDPPPGIPPQVARLQNPPCVLRQLEHGPVLAGWQVVSFLRTRIRDHGAAAGGPALAGRAARGRSAEEARRPRTDSGWRMASRRARRPDIPTQTEIRSLSRTEARRLAARLRDEIRHHDYLYYVLDRPEIDRQSGA